MCSAGGNAALPALGFPIRASRDHRLFSAYPWLIAAVHALHRLKVPRHPPYALTILTVKLAFSTFDHERAYRSVRDLDVTTVQFSRTAEEACLAGLAGRSLKTQQHACRPRPREDGCGRHPRWMTIRWPAKSGRRSRPLGRVCGDTAWLRRTRGCEGNGSSAERFRAGSSKGASLERR